MMAVTGRGRYRRQHCKMGGHCSYFKQPTTREEHHQYIIYFKRCRKCGMPNKGILILKNFNKYNKAHNPKRRTR